MGSEAEELIEAHLVDRCARRYEAMFEQVLCSSRATRAAATRGSLHDGDTAS